MIFKLKQNKNKDIEDTYKESMKELNSFYGINWINDTPKIFIVNNRKEIDFLLNDKTEDWVIGWTNHCHTVFILNRSKIKTESSHRKGYSKGEYRAFIKHELSHLFSKILTKNGYRPIWLWEGLAIYTSGQNEYSVVPEKFSQFLDFYETHTNKNKKSVYYESGFLVEMLIKQFGKEKLLKFLKSIRKVENRKEFDDLFFKTYKFKLNYQEVNRVYRSH